MLRAHATLRAGPGRRLAHHAAAGTSFESEFITERLALNLRGDPEQIRAMVQAEQRVNWFQDDFSLLVFGFPE